jgi:hypothetical protein
MTNTDVARMAALARRILEGPSLSSDELVEFRELARERADVDRHRQVRIGLALLAFVLGTAGR